MAFNDDPVIVESEVNKLISPLIDDLELTTDYTYENEQ